MIRINLLPHREMRRERRKREFLGNAVATAIVGGVLVFAGGFVINQRIDIQSTRNEYVKTALAKLDIEIAEIKTLSEAIASLQARQKAVEDLQSDRTLPVHLFDELVKMMPEGVFLEKLQQVQMTVTLNGFAQSNERVAELLRNLSDRSEWLEKPQLDEIKEVMVKDPGRTATTAPSGIRRAYEFKLNVLIKRRAPAEVPGAPGTPLLPSASAPAMDVAAAGNSGARGSRP